MCSRACSGADSWRCFTRLIKPDGYLAVHDDGRGGEKKLGQAPKCGYEVIEHFRLSSEVWWTEYFEPLEKMVNELREAHAGDENFIKGLADEQKEIDWYKKDPNASHSIFIVMHKVDV